MGNQWQLSYRLRSMRHFFMNKKCCIPAQTSKQSLVLRFSKCGLTFNHLVPLINKYIYSVEHYKLLYSPHGSLVYYENQLHQALLHLYSAKVSLDQSLDNTIRV